MVSSNALKKYGTIFYIGLIILALLLCIGLLLVNPFSSLLYVSGIILGIVLLLPFLLLKKGKKRFVVIIYLFSLLLVGIFSSILFVHDDRPILNYEKIVQYRATLEPLNDELTKFSLNEEILVGFNTDEDLSKTEFVKFEQREVITGNKSFFIREVSFIPLNMNGRGLVSISKNENENFIPLCVFDCPKTTIRIINLPKDSFSEARNSIDLIENPFLDKETITWTTKHPDEGISFSFFPAPYQNFSFIFRPFISVSSMSSFALVLLGLGSASIFTILGGFFSDKIKEIIKTIWDKLFSKTSDKKKTEVGFIKNGDKEE